MNSTVLFSPKTKSMAQSCIEKYFSSQNAFHEGLLDNKYVDLCINTDICSGVDRAYEAIEASQMFKGQESPSPIEKEVKFVIGILRNMSRTVPQEFSAGMLLMHLEFIENIKIG